MYVIKTEQNLLVKSHKTAVFGDKSLKTLGPHTWNSLPGMIKLKTTNLVDFKNSIKKWFGPKCMCNLFSFKNENAENRP